MFTAIALCCAVVFLMYFASPYKNQQKAISVETAIPLNTGIVDSVILRGHVIELGREDVFAKAPSTVDKVYVKAGQYVKKGQIIMDLTPIQDNNKKTYALINELEQSIASANPEEIVDNYKEQLAAMVSQIENGAISAEQEKYSLFSPINGVVMEVSAENGKSTSGFFPCVTVSDMTKLAVMAQVGETNLGKIRENMDCIVTVDALTGKEKLYGRVESIMPYAKQAGLFEQNPDVKTDVIIAVSGNINLRPGYSATAKIATAEKNNVLLIPYSAIMQDENNFEYIFTLQNSVAMKQYINTGYELEEGVEVLNMEDPNTQVILNPEKLKHGSKVEVSQAK